MKNAYPADCIMGNIVFLQEEKRIFGGRVVCMCEGSYAMFTPQGSFDLYLPIWSRPLTDRNITTEHFLAAGMLKNKKLAPLKIFPYYSYLGKFL